MRRVISPALIQSLLLGGTVMFGQLGLAADSDFIDRGPLSPESEAARREIMISTVEPEPVPDPWPIESFGSTRGRMNLREISRRVKENPDMFEREPFLVPRPPLVEVGLQLDSEQESPRIAKRSSIRRLNHDSTSSTPPPPTPVNFLALIDNLQSIPPDTHGAVSRDQVMTSLNSEIRVQNRVGEELLGWVPLEAFWSGISNPSVTDALDPRTLYDPYANRWIVVAVEEPREPESAILLAVSQTSDATGNWNQFRVDANADDTEWADFPSVGFNRHWIVVSVNMFGNQDDLFKRQHIYAFDKDDKYAGGSSTPTPFEDAAANTTVAAVTHDATIDTLYLVSQLSGSPGQLRISTITGTPSSPSYTAGTFNPTSYSWGFGTNEDFAPQLDSTRKIVNGDSRMQRVVYRSGYLWFAHTVFFPASGTPTRSVVQWWQVDTSGTVITRSLIEDSNGDYFYAYPSIAVNKDRDVLIGYSRFAATQYASANYSFRYADDNPGWMRHDTVFRAGEAKYDKDFGGGKNRWGDYSAAVVDPVNDTWMWTIQEHAASPSGSTDRWSTWWAQVMSAPNGDFNRDGHPDILWRYDGGFGDTVIWYMDGPSFSSGAYSAQESDLNWVLEGTIDTNFDAVTEFLWRNYSTGANRVWYVSNNGQTLNSVASLPTVTDTDWKMKGTGDFDYDGERDILWHHRTASTGDIAIWRMSGTGIEQGVVMTQHVTDLNWNIGGSGDFNNDLRTDILWFNSATGDNVVWVMNGTSYVTTLWLPKNGDPNWEMVATADFNEDGQTDIGWRHKTSGENAIWLMNPTNPTVTDSVSVLPTESDLLWKIGGPQ